MKRILLHPETLEHSFTPPTLPHRENKRKTLTKRFINLFESGESYASWIIYGHSGVGKTVLSWRVEKDLREYFKDDLLVAYVNCRQSRKVYRVLVEIVKQIEKTVPEKGLSREDLITLLFQLTAEKKGKLLLILDELGTLFTETEADKTRDMLYSISRFTERFRELENRLQIGVISIIAKSHEYLFYQWLDKSTRASFIKSEINLPRYSKEELFDILKFRAGLAFNPGSVTDDAIDLIASFAADRGEGNARIAIDILRNAGEYADERGDEQLDADHVREILRYHPHMSRIDTEIFDTLEKHKLVLLLSIIRALKAHGKSYVTRLQLEEYYRILCEEYYEKPRKTTQLLRYLKELGQEFPGVLDIEVSGKNQRGRSTRIRINVPLDSLEDHVIKVLERRYGER